LHLSSERWIYILSNCSRDMLPSRAHFCMRTVRKSWPATRLRGFRWKRFRNGGTSHRYQQSIRLREGRCHLPSRRPLSYAGTKPPIPGQDTICQRRLAGVAPEGRGKGEGQVAGEIHSHPILNAREQRITRCEEEETVRLSRRVEGLF